MKKLWTLIKLIAEAIYAVTEGLISIIYSGVAFSIFSKLKWNWARKVESKLAFRVLSHYERMLASVKNIIEILSMLGKNTRPYEMRLEQDNDKLSDFWKEGSRIYGWKIIRIHGFTALIK